VVGRTAHHPRFHVGPATRPSDDGRTGVGQDQHVTAAGLPRRIGVIGDVHAEDDKLERLIAYLSDEGCDLLLCTGDIVTGTGSPDRCVELLEEAGVVTVRGNHDRWLLEGVTLGFTNEHRLAALTDRTAEFLRGLPDQVALRTAGPDLLLCHGLGADDMNRITADDYGYALEANDSLQRLLADPAERLIVKGHRHSASVWRIRQLMLVDAGCLTNLTSPSGAVIDPVLRTVTQLGVTSTGVTTLPPLPFAA